MEWRFWRTLLGHFRFVEVVGSVAMFEVLLLCHWGKGLFLKCLEALRSTLSEGDHFFGFPNQNSKRGFEKFGWNEGSLARPWFAPASLVKGKLEEHDGFDELARGDSFFVKDREYME